MGGPWRLEDLDKFGKRSFIQVLHKWHGFRPQLCHGLVCLCLFPLGPLCLELAQGVAAELEMPLKVTSTLLFAFCGLFL